MKTDNVFVLVIFLIFASSVLLVLIFGGSTYHRIAEISQNGSDERILLSYVRTKIRTGDVGGSISVENFHGISALSIEENFDERSFVTYIYLHDGWVRELFFENGENFFPDDGTPIVKGNFLNFESINGGLIRVEADSASMLILPRSEGS